jgi:hypothetical protein
MEKEVKVYEYVTTSDWIQSLEKGSRFYYDLNKGVYEFHTENDHTDNNEFFLSTSSYSRTVTLQPHMVSKLIEQKRLEAGPELGELVAPTKEVDQPKVETEKPKVVRFVEHPDSAYMRRWFALRDAYLKLYWL